MTPVTKRLSDLIADLSDAELHGDEGVQINAVRYDSRLVQKGDLFVAIKGYATDGHRYIPEAIARGAAAVVHEEPWDRSLQASHVRVASSRKALALISSCFFDHPERDLKLIGVTGTNGKTTIAYMLWSVFQNAMPPAGMIGTIENRIGDQPLPAIHTTPESLDLCELFDRMRQERVQVVAMEVSSHALVLDRVYGLDFSAAVFTNLSHEHLDFHHTIAEYRDAKSLLFKNLRGAATAVLNEDDPVSDTYKRMTSARVWTYSLNNPRADLYGHEVETDWEGTRLTVRTSQGETRFETPLVGSFNASNLLAAVGAALALEVPLDDIRQGLSMLLSVPGRFERVPLDVPFTVIVDYAHTPDALDNCLRTARSMPGERLITVFGCGGDRDRKKRPVMGKIAQNLSDLIVITSDNPRTEDPKSIIEDITAELSGDRPFIVEVDRRKAICKALTEAHPGDVVVVAGKGHESYQQIQDRKEPFDDRQVVAECL